MDNEILTNLNIMTDEEIGYYNELKSLYIQKKEFLINHKIEELWELDAVIGKKISQIKQLTKNKKNILNKNFPSKNRRISLIEIAKETDINLSEKFAEQKEKLQNLMKELGTLEYTIKELIKQGLDFTGKMINSISGETFLNLSEYNQKGENNKMEGFSSIEQSV